ncbi:MAG: DNA methyltransferase [Peptostreptococcaceae bacterium]
MEDIFKVSYDKDIDEEVNKLFNYWRIKGFPNYESRDYDKSRELDKLIKYNENNIICGKDLKQTMHSCGFLWTYFPHWVNVKCGSETNSLLDNWNNDNKLKTLIKKTYKWQLKHGNGIFTINRLRQNSKVYLNKQSVSNFRPTVAKYIYNTYGNNGIVWDMSCGWGGRLFGFLSSNCNKYIGTEPSKLTYEGLVKLKEDYNYINKDIEINCIGSEDFSLLNNEVDLCFTSPPYFDTEKYADEETQSYIKFPSKNEWLEGYLHKTISNCYLALKTGGYMIINIANTKNFTDIENETIRLAIEDGFEHEDTLNLILSSISGKGVKREPVFIFKKV